MLYITPGTSPDILADTSVPIIATEGEFKTIALSRLDGFLAIGFSGVWNWKGKRGIEPGSRRQINGPIPDLDMITWTGRRVYVIFDSDAARNAAIRGARFALCDELESRGAIAFIIELPDLEGLEKTGADDFLAHPDGGPERLLQLIQSALPVKPPTVAELLDASGISELTKGVLAGRSASRAARTRRCPGDDQDGQTRPGVRAGSVEQASCFNRHSGHVPQ